MSSLTSTLTADRLRELLSYDPETGQFRWRVSLARKTKVGSLAGWISEIGYVLICICGVKHRAHRLAWLHVYGEWPSMDTDHINGNKADNRIANLRDVPRSINTQNSYSPRANKTGFRGVHRVLRPMDPYVAELRIGGLRHKLGYFATPEDAGAAYMAAKARMHPGAVPERIALAVEQMATQRVEV